MRRTSATAAAAARAASDSSSDQSCTSLSDAIARNTVRKRRIDGLARRRQNDFAMPASIQRAEKGSSPGLPPPPTRQFERCR